MSRVAFYRVHPTQVVKLSDKELFAGRIIAEYQECRTRMLGHADAAREVIAKAERWPVKVEGRAPEDI